MPGFVAVILSKAAVLDGTPRFVPFGTVVTHPTHAMHMKRLCESQIFSAVQIDVVWGYLQAERGAPVGGRYWEDVCEVVRALPPAFVVVVRFVQQNYSAWLSSGSVCGAPRWAISPPEPVVASSTPDSAKLQQCWAYFCSDLLDDYVGMLREVCTALARTRLFLIPVADPSLATCCSRQQIASIHAACASLPATLIAAYADAGVACECIADALTSYHTPRRVYVCEWVYSDQGLAQIESQRKCGCVLGWSVPFSESLPQILRDYAEGRLCLTMLAPDKIHGEARAGVVAILEASKVPTKAARCSSDAPVQAPVCSSEAPTKASVCSSEAPVRTPRCSSDTLPLLVMWVLWGLAYLLYVGTHLSMFDADFAATRTFVVFSYSISAANFSFAAGSAVLGLCLGRVTWLVSLAWMSLGRVLAEVDAFLTIVAAVLYLLVEQWIFLGIVMGIHALIVVSYIEFPLIDSMRSLRLKSV